MSKKYDTRKIMSEAWMFARISAEMKGGKPSEYLPSCLKVAWKNAKESLGFDEMYDKVEGKIEVAYNNVTGGLVNQATDFEVNTEEYQTAFNFLNNTEEVIKEVKKELTKKFPKTFKTMDEIKNKCIKCKVMLELGDDIKFINSVH